MRLGILIPHRAVVLQSARRPPVETCWTVARLCDAAGLDLWVGDSIVATYLTDDDCRTLRARGEEALAQHGRSLPHFPLCVYTTVRLDADVERAETTTRAFLQQYYGGGVHYHGLMGLGPASTVIDMIERYEAAGVTDLCIRLVGDDQEAQLEQFIHEVVPACTT